MYQINLESGASNLKKAREASGKSIAKLCEEIGRSETVYRRFENAETYPSMAMFIKLANALNFSCTYLFSSYISEEAR